MIRVTLTEFLLARIAEDVAAADESLPDDGTVGTWSNWVLAECEKNRRIVELHSDPHHDVIRWADPEEQRKAARSGDLWCRTCGSVDDCPISWPCDTLKALALPYADHPDYREEWRA